MELKAILGDSYREGMTAAEIETALAGVEMVSKAEVDANFVPKATADKYASEAAKYRKERNTAQGDNTALAERVKELEKREQLSTLKAQFVARGMTEEDAATAAEAQYGGDTSKVFELWGALITKTKEQAASDKLHDMTTPPGGGSSGDVADFAKEKDAALKAGNIPLYTSLVRREAEAKASKH